GGRLEAAPLQGGGGGAWALGPPRPALARRPPASTDAVRRLYLEDYRKQWRAFIDDITIIRDRDLPKTIEIVSVLAAPDTPLKILLKALERETSLSAPDTHRLAGLTRKGQQLPSPSRPA